MSQGYDIDGIEPGASSGGGGSEAWTTADIAELLANTGVVLVETAAVHNTAYADENLYGWSLRNTFAGLSTVFIRLGNDAADTPFIPINLAENETITQIFEHPISNASGFFFDVEVGAITGILYTGAVGS